MLEKQQFTTKVNQIQLHMESLHSRAFSGRNEIRLGRNLGNEKIIMEIKLTEMLNSILDRFFSLRRYHLVNHLKCNNCKIKSLKKSVHGLSICVCRERENMRLCKKIVAGLILEDKTLQVESPL